MEIGTREFPALELGDRIRRQSDFRAATLLAKAGLKSDAAEYTRLAPRTESPEQCAGTARRRGRRPKPVTIAACPPSSSTTSVSISRQPATDLPEDFWRLAYLDRSGRRSRHRRTRTMSTRYCSSHSCVRSRALILRHARRLAPSACSKSCRTRRRELGPQAGVGHLTEAKMRER